MRPESTQQTLPEVMDLPMSEYGASVTLGVENVRGIERESNEELSYEMAKLGGDSIHLTDFIYA